MGCAMGIVCAPSYCKLFMAQSEKHIPVHQRHSALLSLRYIDDILFIWKGTKEQFVTFINKLDKKQNIEYEYEISSQNILLARNYMFKVNNRNTRTKV